VQSVVAEVVIQLVEILALVLEERQHQVVVQEDNLQPLLEQMELLVLQTLVAVVVVPGIRLTLTVVVMAVLV
jgi:hypothetical protein